MMINRRNWNYDILTLNTQSRYCNNPLNKNFRFYGQTVGDVGPNKNRILGAKLAKLRHAPMKRDRISRVLDQKPVLARTEKQFPRCLRPPLRARALEAWGRAGSVRGTDRSCVESDSAIDRARLVTLSVSRSSGAGLDRTDVPAPRRPPG